MVSKTQLDPKKMRTKTQKFKDFITLPFRSLTLFEENKWGLTSIKDERFEYVASEVLGKCLDIGCGRGNLFIKKHLHGNGLMPSWRKLKIKGF